MIDIKEFQKTGALKLIWNNFTKNDRIIHLGGAGSERKIHKYNIDPSKIYFVDPLYKETKHPCYRIAITDQDGYIDFHQAGSWQNSSIYKDHPDSISHSYRVKTLCMSSFLERYNIDYVDYLISNTEGSEYLMFKSESITFLNYIGILCVDLHKNVIKNDVEEKNCIIKEIKDYGFKTITYDKSDCTRLLGVKDDII